MVSGVRVLTSMAVSAHGLQRWGGDRLIDASSRPSRGWRISRLVRKPYVIVVRGRWPIMLTMTNDDRVVKSPPYGNVVSNG